MPVTTVITITLMTTAIMHTAVVVQNTDTVTSKPSGVEETVVTPAVIYEGGRKTPDEDSEGENVNKK